MKITLWLAIAFSLFLGFNALAVSGQVDWKIKIETTAAEVKTECLEIAGLSQQYLGICMETLCMYEKYQKEIGVSADEIEELRKEIAGLPDKIEYFLNKPDLLEEEISGLDFNDAEECRYALNVLHEMSIALHDSIIQLKAQIKVKTGVLQEIKIKTIVPEIKERFIVIKKETDNLIAIQNDLAGIYNEALDLLIKHQEEFGTSIEEIEYYQKVIQDLRVFSDNFKKGLGTLEYEINNLLNPDKYEECAAFSDYIENYLAFIVNQKKNIMEEIMEAAACLESLNQQLGGEGCPNE